MKAGTVVHRTVAGKAAYAWTTDKGQKMYRIDFTDGRYLHTNSLEIVRQELKGELVQLEIFKAIEQLENQTTTP